MKELNAALIKAKQEFGPVLKDKNNPGFKSKYADLGAVLEAIEGPLLKNGLYFNHLTEIDEQGRQTVIACLTHADTGQQLMSTWMLKPVKDDPQGMGSALTYGRRYTTLAMFSIAPEDDDGNAASRRDSAPPPPPRDWLKEMAAATTAEQVRSLGRQAGQVGDWEKFEAQFRARVAELEPQPETEAAKPSE